MAEKKKTARAKRPVFKKAKVAKVQPEGRGK